MHEREPQVVGVKRSTARTASHAVHGRTGEATLHAHKAGYAGAVAKQVST